MSTLTSGQQPVLEMREIVKDFPGVRALDEVSLSAWPGEVLALVGENGAGKSTLMKVLSGVWPYPEYQGELYVKGRLSRFTHTHEAEAAGIAIIYQELNLVYGLTVAENIFLGHMPVSAMGFLDRETMIRQTRDILDHLHLENLDPESRVADLSVGQQQMVEIAKALSQQAEILILDEPTSALSDRETRELFSVISELKARGVAMIYISHKMDEIRQIADRILVMRDGRTIGTPQPAHTLSLPEIIRRMVGRDIQDLYPAPQARPSSPCLEVKGLSLPHPVHSERFVLKDISFAAHQGEILGIAGLMGSGRTELVTALFGAWPHHLSGQVSIHGQTLGLHNPAASICAGMALVTEDRKLQGLLLEQDLVFNTTLASLTELCNYGLMDKVQEYALSHSLHDKLATRAASLDVPVKTLSGGNQQKVVLAKWLATHPRVLFLDEPTRGIDIGAKVEIYRLIDQLAREGMCIIMISSELPEILGMSDRIMVLHQGSLAGILERSEASEELIMSLATGTGVN